MVNVVRKIERMSRAAEALVREAHCVAEGRRAVVLTMDSHSWNEGEEVPFKDGGRRDKMKGLWGKDQ
jgi:hypothetical protein